MLGGAAPAPSPLPLQQAHSREATRKQEARRGVPHPLAKCFPMLMPVLKGWSLLRGGGGPACPASAQSSAEHQCS